MKTIKFSHWYEKLKGVIVRDEPRPLAKLLQVIKIQYNDLSEDMKKYDTEYFDGSELCRYILPKTELILLIFQSTRTNKIFPTIRRYTYNKWKYYKDSEGEIFFVKIL